MTTLTETPRTGEFIVSEAPGRRSREQILLTGDNSTTVKACTVLGAVETGTPTLTVGTPFSGVGGTVGNGTISAATADAGAMPGDWQLECTATGATGKFKVIKPDGTIDGILTIGTAYNGTRSINITVADGSNDWLVGDIIPINVAYLDGESVLKYEAYDQDGTDGSQIAAGILYGPVVGTTAGADAVAVTRDAEVNGRLLVWPADITADEKAKAITQLAALGIILRS
ncbi:head decoration protein [Erythrobacter sp. SG61-1L]|uniref:head decoration protein n=1 Tax=Erythrobacter sp. SG61-1L TaxID=1603897 RepID=UPI0006C91275|nr:head decoration protein [Erythrobacter sp. SG61-1L]